MKLCLMILSIPWYKQMYMFNVLEHTAILSHFLTFITGSSSRLLRIRFSAAVTLYWFPVRHFQCKEFNPLVIWIWNQNIAISTIVGTSSHIMEQKCSDASNNLFKAPKSKISYLYKCWAMGKPLLNQIFFTLSRHSALCQVIYHITQSI